MTSPEQHRQQDAARRSLNNITQPQFHNPPNNVPPLYRGGAYYPGVHHGFIPQNVAQPLGMHALLNSGSSAHLYGMHLTAALCNGAVKGQPVDSHVIICHTSVTCETSLLCLYIYHIRCVNMI